MWRPPVIGGEHRMLPFSCRSYVTQLRELVCAKTGSYAFDCSAETLGAAYERPIIENCVAADGLTRRFLGSFYATG